MELSIISPVYNANELVNSLVEEIIQSVSSYIVTFEIILIDDGSSDDSWEKIEINCKKDLRVKGIKLSRNFGQHYAVAAGIEKAMGENIVIMDCDLQDNPDYVKKMLEERRKGYEIVFTSRVNRRDSVSKKLKSWIYKKLFSLLSDSKFNIDSGSLVLFSKTVAETILKLKEKDRLYLQMLKWVGFKTSTISVIHRKRPFGKTSYNFSKLLRMGIEGWTSHSVKLLRLNIYLGLFIAFLSALGVIYVLVNYLMFNLMPGWPSLIIAMMFSTGLIMFSIGIVGIYIGKIFNQVKDRPLYLIEKEIN